MAIFLVALGFFAAQERAYRMATPLLDHDLSSRQVEATIEGIEPVENKDKIILSDPIIEGLSPEETPKRLRISFRNQELDLKAGDRISFTANLYPLPAPIMPDSYDFARHFYFKGIGGNGFALGAAQKIDPAARGGVFAWFSNLRHTIGEDMRSRIEGATGPVAAAMTVGETGPIPEETQVLLRDSGLAHMLSISGLHLAIAAGVVFYIVRLLLTLYPPLALRLPVKKIAALFALVSAFIYLLLSGSPVPAQRSFVMVAFLFLAMLLDRRGISLRTLMIAAMAILLLLPESMLGPSFQMSFAATLAIVCLYENGKMFHGRPGASWITRTLLHALGIVVTSLAATLATAPFILYHFNRFAIFGLISNMAVIPLATFMIMPGIVLSLLLMPLGLQGWGYALLGLGTQWMIDISAWVTALPYSSLAFASPTGYGMVTAALGLLSLCLIHGSWRWLGLPIMALGLSTIGLHIPVGVLISDDAKQAIARLPDGRYTALRGTIRSFTIENWLRSEGQDALVAAKNLPPDSGVTCDKTMCIYRNGKHTLALVKKTDNEKAWKAACDAKPDILVAWWYFHLEDYTQCGPPLFFIGRRELENHGAHAIRFHNAVIDITYTREKGQRRLWQPDYHNGDDGEDY